MILSLAAALLLAATGAPPESLTLEEALDEASRTNADLRVARAQLEAARADVVSAWSGLLPRLDLQATFGHTFDGASTYVDPRTGERVPELALPATDFESYRASLQLRQPVFDGLRALREVQQARASRRAAVLQVDEAALETGFEVARRFYGLLRAERTLRVLERAVTRSDELVMRAAELVIGGRGTKADVIQARVNLANDLLAVEAQRLQVHQARSALATILGRPGDAPVAAIPPAALDAPGVPSDDLPPLDALVARAREARPGLRAQAALVSAADRGVGAARAGYWPQVSAVGSYARSGPALSGAAGVYDDPRRDYVAEGQIVLAWNLFAGRETAAAVRRARASRDAAIAAADRFEQALAKEVADARAAVSGLGKQIVIAASTVTAAEQGLEIARERAEAGRGTQLEVRDANLKLTNAELALAQARIDRAIALADLARATGALP